MSAENESSTRDNRLSPLDNPENSMKESRDEQIFVEIQEELNQQKDCLLKDIRLIQKKKIKEMEELYELKLKKKSYEQELEDTKLEIKRIKKKIPKLNVLSLLAIVYQPKPEIGKS